MPSCTAAIMMHLLSLLVVCLAATAQAGDSPTNTSTPPPKVRECYTCNTKVHDGCWPFDRKKAEVYRRNCTKSQICRKVWQKDGYYSTSESVYRDCSSNHTNALRRGRNGVRYETFHCFKDLCNASYRVSIHHYAVLCLSLRAAAYSCL